MKKEYKIRGKVFSVNELEGIRAVKPAFRTDEFFNDVIALVDSGAKNLFKNLKAERPVAKDQLRSFSNAGWVFVGPPREEILKLDVRNFSLPEIQQSGRVYNDSQGNILISTNRISLKLMPELSAEQVHEFLTKNQLSMAKSLGFAPNLYEVQIRTSDVIDAVNRLTSLPEVMYAEPQMITHIPSRFKPNDPLYSKQWQHNNDSNNGILAGADVKSEHAWNLAQGKGVKIAIIDNGFDVTHPDISPSLHSSSGYFTSTDTNYVFKRGTAGFPNNPHGTFCAGMAVARESNGSGGCGLAHQADFIAIACLGDQVGTQATLARAIAYAVNPALEIPSTPSGMGADVISCSLGPNGADWTMESVLEDALSFAALKGRGGKGTPVFWAVSNGNFTINGIDGIDEVSASDNTISVGRSRSDDSEDGSAFGTELDFLAPGVRVFSTTSGGGYGFNSGTSFATPLAAAAAAVLLSKNPNLSWTDIRDVLRKSCDKVGGVVYNDLGHHEKYGFGRINLYEALKLV